MLYQRDGGVDVTVDCPKNLIIATDCLRLKQIMLNLGRNSTKFVHSGFIRFRAAVVDGVVEVYVEDSGPGIPIEKRGALFEKFQSSLDVLSQGTGIGLSLVRV
jgi:signal transduction histidine kinase